MKILIFAEVYYPDVMGGGEFSTKQMTEGLTKRGHEVIVYCLGKDTREERIKLLGDLDYGIYKKWKEPVSWRDGIKKKLLCSRRFKLYDLITGSGMPQ